MKNKIIAAIEKGLTAKGSGPCCGCGRTYVGIAKTDRKTLNAFKEAAKAVGLRYLKEAYGTGGRVIYVGYDNASGRQLAQAQAIADNLDAIGVPAYWDAVPD